MADLVNLGYFVKPLNVPIEVTYDGTIPLPDGASTDAKINSLITSIGDLADIVSLASKQDSVKLVIDAIKQSSDDIKTAVQAINRMASWMPGFSGNAVSVNVMSGGGSSGGGFSAVHILDIPNLQFSDHQHVKIMETPPTDALKNNASISIIYTGNGVPSRFVKTIGATIYSAAVTFSGSFLKSIGEWN